MSTNNLPTKNSVSTKRNIRVNCFAEKFIDISTIKDFYIYILYLCKLVKH